MGSFLHPILRVDMKFSATSLHVFIFGVCVSMAALSSCNSVKNSSRSREATEALPPIMGWASWNNYRVAINEEIIRSQADAMVKLGLTNFGYRYINTDDGFFGGRDAEGKILSHPQRFPSGMKALAGYIHAKGLKAGIYSDAGINTCASYYDKDTIGSGMGLYGHLEQDMTTYLKEWNYDFIKVDWCGANWMGLNEQQQYTAIAEAARRIKPDVVYNVCRWQFPGAWVTGLAHSWRIAGDLSENFNSVLHTIDANAGLWMHSSRGHYNDMDMLQVGRGMSYEEDKAHFSMWCIMQSPLLLGNDLTKISDETLKIITNKDLIEINQSPFVYQARRLVDQGDLEVWARPMAHTMSGDVVVALLNRSKETQPISVDLSTVGIEASRTYTVKDLWTKEEIAASSAASVTRTVPSHGVVVLRIKGKAVPFNIFQYKDKK